MSKPTTTYTPVTKPKTNYVSAAKPTTSYVVDTGVTLGSMTVRLDSLTVYLTGYTVNPPPVFVNNKNKTTYTPL